MIDTTTKPRRFYRNLVDWGFQFDIDEAGQLVVTTPAKWAETCTGGCPPPLRDAIIARSHILAKLVRLDQLTGRPLLLAEFHEARRLAAETGAKLDWERLDLNGEQAGVWSPIDHDGGEIDIDEDDRAAAQVAAAVDDDQGRAKTLTPDR